MAIEVLIGNALMKCGYTRYFHTWFLEGSETLSRGRTRIGEVANFSVLSLIALVVISAVCTNYFIMFDGFSGVKPPQDKMTHLGKMSENAKLWVEFFYFATTTFCTVGFGDIVPSDISARVLVTLVHFLTFGYVLFLLQVLLSQQGEGLPELNPPD
jgi:hypothetical protein